MLTYACVCSFSKSKYTDIPFSHWFLETMAALVNLRFKKWELKPSTPYLPTPHCLRLAWLSSFRWPRQITWSLIPENSQKVPQLFNGKLSAVYFLRIFEWLPPAPFLAAPTGAGCGSAIHGWSSPNPPLVSHAFTQTSSPQLSPPGPPSLDTTGSLWPRLITWALSSVSLHLAVMDRAHADTQQYPIKLIKEIKQWSCSQL